MSNIIPPRMVYRSGKLVNKEEWDKANPYGHQQTFRLYVCAKCHTVVTGTLAEQHINNCQGGFASCAQCHRRISAADFISHFDTCKGVPGKEGVASVSERESESDKPPG